jgi:multimeric flavodoxin WrbA
MFLCMEYGMIRKNAGGMVMNVVAILGSPRKNGNSAALLDAALKGAAESGAVCERIDLFDLQYKGCVSCFGCKRLGGASYGRCAQKDALTPVLEKILAADVLLLATPLYFGEVPGAVRNLLQRL